MIAENLQATADLTGASLAASSAALCEMLLAHGRAMRRETSRCAAFAAGPQSGVGEWG